MKRKYIMQEKEKIVVNCVDLNHEGQGVCKHEQFPIFVDFLLVGETAEIEITKLNKNYGFGKIIKLITQSTSRITPKCFAFGKCGGCEIMHMDYPSQLAFKKQMGINTLKKIGHLTDLPISGIVGMEIPYYYRNKVQIPFQMQNNQVVCGFYAKSSHNIYPMKECFIQPKYATDIALFVRDFANKHNIKAYNEKSNQGILRHILLRKNIHDEYMVVIITNTKDLPYQRELIETLISNFPQIKTIVQNWNPNKTNVILGNKNVTLFGTGILQETLLDLTFTVSPHSFFQTNHIQTEKLYRQVLAYANPKPTDIIVDGYCGVGTISCFIAKHCKRLFGIEVVKEAIQDARANALINGIDNITFIVGKTEEELKKLVDQKIDILIVDPPRKGCDGKLIETIQQLEIPKIIYVSCDVATLARDLSLLSNEYEIKDLTFFDMFPQICDVETCVLLEHK